MICSARKFVRRLHKFIFLSLILISGFRFPMVWNAVSELHHLEIWKRGECWIFSLERTKCCGAAALVQRVCDLCYTSNLFRISMNVVLLHRAIFHMQGESSPSSNQIQRFTNRDGVHAVPLYAMSCTIHSSLSHFGEKECEMNHGIRRTFQETALQRLETAVTVCTVILLSNASKSSK